MSDGALSIAVAALQQIAQLGSQERDRVTARAALDCIDALCPHTGITALVCSCPLHASAVREQEAT